MAVTIQARRTFQPDVVLLDVRLPDGDGFQLRARLMQRRPELKVVVSKSVPASNGFCRNAVTIAALEAVQS